MKFNIKKFNPCHEALEYYETKETFKDAWENCPRGDWMLWIASKLKVDVRTLTLAKGLCAKTVMHLMKDQRSINAVNDAISFGKGLINESKLKKSAAAAYAAAAAAYAAYDAAAADAAADAAAAAYAAAAAADAAAYAAATADADAAAAAYAAVADAAAKKENQEKTANICRDILTKEIFKIIDKHE